MYILREFHCRTQEWNTNICMGVVNHRDSMYAQYKMFHTCTDFSMRIVLNHSHFLRQLLLAWTPSNEGTIPRQILEH